MSNQLKIVLDSIAISERLLQIAEADDWDTFLKLDEQRQGALMNLKLDADALDDDELIELTDSMVRLIDLNQQLEAICKQQRQMVVEELQKFKQGNKAHKAYSA